MKGQHRGSRQGKMKRQRSRDSASQRQQIRRATTRQAAQTTSTRRQVSDSVGSLDVNSALDAVRSMGIRVDSKGNVDTAAARKVAEGAAISAAQALGIAITNADGSINTAKAREAIESVLGFSVERGGTAAQSEAIVRSQKAAENATRSMLQTANALGANPDSLEANIRDANGNVDTAKVLQIANIALTLRVASQRQLGRRDAVETLNASLEAATTDNPLSRRAASDAIEKLLAASVLVDGKIDRQKALDLRSSFSTE